MERRVVLDFIAQNYLMLKSVNFEKINIYLYGKNYQKDTLASNLLDGENLFIYDVKLPRVYCKMMPLEKMNDGLLEFASTLDNIEILKKSDFDFDIEDVYSGKNISSLDFEYLYLCPIIKDNLKQGLIVIFAKELELNFKLIPSSVTLLFNLLQEVDLKMFEQNVISSIIDYDDYYFILKELNSNDIIISDSLKDKWQTKERLNKNSEQVLDFMNHYSVKEKRLKFPFEKYYLYYIEKNIYDDRTSNYLHINALDKLQLPKDFTLLIIDWSQNDIDFSLVVEELKLNKKYYICAYDNEYYLLFVEGKVNNSEFKKVLKDYDSLYFVLSAPRQINNKMDFIKLMSYIKNEHPLDFSCDDYIKYINTLNEEIMIINKNAYRQKSIISSIDESKKGVLINFVNDNFKHNNSFFEFERKTITKLNNYIKKDNDPVFVCFNSSSLLKRKVLEIYKKYLNKNIDLNVIIHFDKKMNKDEFIKSLSIAKENNITLIADSSIFLNLEFVDLMRYFSGCYVKNDEFNSINNSPNEFVNMFVSYYFNNNKFIVFDGYEKEYLLKYKDELIYFVKESEGI